MKIQFLHKKKTYLSDLDAGVDCSSTYGLPEREPAAWHCAPTEIAPVQNGAWIGAVEQGAAINFFSVQLNPHGNGTHTEGLGHISPDHRSVNEHLRKFHGLLYFLRMPAQKRNGDRLLCHEDLPDIDFSQLDAVAIAADDIDFPQNFSGKNAPYFEAEILEVLRLFGVEHFVTNLPSVDREEDGGALAAHRAWWHYPQSPRLEATITELAHFPPSLAPGLYFYNLQVAPLHNDAAPSRLMLYPLLET